jgi:NAD(P)H-dependent FMN reductase
MDIKKESPVTDNLDTRPHVVAISGNVQRPSKSRAPANRIAQSVASRLDIRVAVFDLIDAGPGLGAAYQRGQHQLRPLFGFFSALTVPSAIYASDHEFKDGVPFEPVLNDRIELAATQFASIMMSRRLVGLPANEAMKAARAA